MIGVVAKESEYPEVRELFELFKTPWEFYINGHEYNVVLCSSEQRIEKSAKLVLVYGKPNKAARARTRAGQVAVRSYGGERTPIYGECFALSGDGRVLLTIEGSGECAALEECVEGQKVVRVGYDLFYEIRYLLTKGQSAAEARVPTLELHISFLRDVMLRASIRVAEIPPVPAGYKFIACLTHDVDHPAIRNHFCDHTMFGFLYRATLGSLLDFFRGRKSFKQLVLNAAATLSLPFVYLGWSKDAWTQLSRYMEIEKGMSSTFFVIPRKGYAGVALDRGRAPKRAAKYSVAGIRNELETLQRAGCEIGVHGIDAWSDAASGRRELKEIRALTGKREVGVRMHWLYFAENSHAALDEAGYSYDSTCGYNQTVGYRAGTLQVFKPLSSRRLLELPMHVMDTALFFGSYSNFSPKQADATVSELMEHAVKFGGVLTFNWHDRSIAPERLWDETYIGFLAELRKRGAWITNAGQAVAWFRKRRCAEIDETMVEEESKCAGQSEDGLPGLKLRIHQNVPGAAESIESQKALCPA